MEPAIHLRDLNFAWQPGRHLIDIANLRIERAERILLMGASGSGKSTLIGLLTGIIEPQAGVVEILGQNLGAMSRARRDRFRGASIGLIFQMFNLVPYLSVVENVLLPQLFGRRSPGGRTSDDAAEARRLLTALGLDDPLLLKRPVATLSQGQQQRVAAARALFGRPGLLIADEPTSALDAQARDLFLQLLGAECSAAGIALLLVSHDPSIAPHFDRTLNMADLGSGKG